MTGVDGVGIVLRSPETVEKMMPTIGLFCFPYPSLTVSEPKIEIMCMLAKGMEKRLFFGCLRRWPGK